MCDWNNAVSCTFLLLREFPVLKFIDDSLQCSRRTLCHDPGCLNGVLVSGEVGSPFVMMPELELHALLSLMQTFVVLRPVS
jgi:hypothetical protein